jgi:hypothetical protein
MLRIVPSDDIIADTFGFPTALTPRQRCYGLLTSARIHQDLARVAMLAGDTGMAQSALETAREKLAAAKKLTRESISASAQE